jgi:ribosomal peptide maturation radical SAM protein 1
MGEKIVNGRRKKRLKCSNERDRRGHEMVAREESQRGMASNNVSRSEQESTFRVALVCMPFRLVSGPSPAIGLLQAITERAGFATDTHHLELNLAAQLGPEVYASLCHGSGSSTPTTWSLFSEWLFGIAAFGGEVASGDAAYLAAHPDAGDFVSALAGDTDYVQRLRNEILPRFIDECANSIDWGGYRVVGFSSTYLQNVASLALARRIKERWPQVVIVFGGANMEGEAGEEYMRALPVIDYVVVGDGDHAFPALLSNLASEKSPEDVPGLVMRTTNGVRSTGPAQIFHDLDSLPTPNYDEFFERARRLGIDRRADVGWSLSFEGSRGCWWGEKSQCTFCGFNSAGIAYRSKSPKRVFDELAELAQKYGITSFSSTDSIMEMRFVEEFFARVQETKTDFEFYIETRASLTREQIRTLQRGGVRVLQPGIESLSTHVLRLMRKNTTMLHNVRCLKWSRYYGIVVSWNVLWDFPGEREEDYRRELEVMKLLSHLDPPVRVGPLIMARFSPLFVDHESFLISNLRPKRSYSWVYPPAVADDKIAMFFDCEAGDTVAPETHDEAVAWVEEWQRRSSSTTPDTLVSRRTPGMLMIEDNRGSERRGTYTFGDPVATIYSACDESMLTPKGVCKAMTSDGRPPKVSENDVREILNEFCRLGLMVGENDRYLSLAIPANPNW